jgi:tRNA (uracil-5-)-methyltransferase
MMRAHAQVRSATLRASNARFFSGSANPAAADGGGGVRRRFSAPARPRRGSSRNHWQWQTTRARLDVAVRPETYREELDAKIERARAHFAASSSSSASDGIETEEVPLPETEVFESARSHFRMRAEFRVWHEGDASFLAMFDSDDPKTPVEVPQFPMGSEKINELMPALLAEIQASETLRKKLFQVNFLTTVKGEAMISMLYHRRLNEEWEAEAETMRVRLGVSIVGRSRKQKVRRRRAKHAREKKRASRFLLRFAPSAPPRRRGFGFPTTCLGASSSLPVTIKHESYHRILPEFRGEDHIMHHPLRNASGAREVFCFCFFFFFVRK